MITALNVDYKEWAEKYKLKIQEKTCINCNHTFLATVPVADKSLRSLRIPDHGCPAEYNYSYFVITDEKLEASLLESISKF